eukprot:7929938-Pyramimonas_sp.AAC.1
MQRLRTIAPLPRTKEGVFSISNAARETATCYALRGPAMRFCCAAQAAVDQRNAFEEWGYAGDVDQRNAGIIQIILE